MRGLLREQLQKVRSVVGVEAERESLTAGHERHPTHSWGPPAAARFEAPVLIDRRVWHLPFSHRRPVATAGSVQHDAVISRDELTPEGNPRDPTHQQPAPAAHEATPAPRARNKRATLEQLQAVTLGPIVRLAASLGGQQGTYPDGRLGSSAVVEPS